MSGGTVWEADDNIQARSVAVAILSVEPATDPEAKDRLERRIRALRMSEFARPCVETIVRFGQESGTYFVVMELVHGETVAERIRRAGAFPPLQAVRVAIAAAMCLQAAHDLGIAHGELDAGRVVLSNDRQVKVLDLGLTTAAWATPSRAAEDPRGGDGQRDGILAEPERHADVAALGALLLEMLTGRKPPAIRPAPRRRLLRRWMRWEEDVTDVRTDSARGALSGAPEALLLVCQQAIGTDVAERPETPVAFARMAQKAAERWVQDRYAKRMGARSVGPSSTSIGDPAVTVIPEVAGSAEGTREPSVTRLSDIWGTAGSHTGSRATVDVAEPSVTVIPDAGDHDRGETPNATTKLSIVRAAWGHHRLGSRRILVGAVASVLVACIALAVMAVASRSQGPATGSQLPRTTLPAVGGATSPAVSPVTIVPDVVGLTVSGARERLLAAHLTLAEVRPVVGEPGAVVRTSPVAGTTVPPGSPITLLVGVEAERLKPSPASS